MPLTSAGLHANSYRMVSGLWYSAVDGPLTTVIPAEGQTRYVQFTAPNELTLDGIGVEFTVAGTTGAVVKMVVKFDNQGTPGATQWSSTGLDATGTPGLLSANPGVNLKRGNRRWLGCNVQGGAGTRPTLRALNLRFGPVLNGMGATACWAASGETADTFGTPTPVNANPIAIMVKTS